MVSGWLKDYENPIFGYLTSLVESVTKLSLKSAEDWQVTN
jgi:hypothetical protein